MVTQEPNVYLSCAVLSLSVMSDFATPWTEACSSGHGDSLGKNTGVVARPSSRGSSQSWD